MCLLSAVDSTGRRSGVRAVHGITWFSHRDPLPSPPGLDTPKWGQHRLRRHRHHQTRKCKAELPMAKPCVAMSHLLHPNFSAPEAGFSNRPRSTVGNASPLRCDGRDKCPARCCTDLHFETCWAGQETEPSIIWTMQNQE